MLSPNRLQAQDSCSFHKTLSICVNKQFLSKKETPEQLLSCESYEVFKNTFLIQNRAKQNFLKNVQSL